jgi:heat shock protein HslJ
MKHLAVCTALLPLLAGGWFAVGGPSEAAVYREQVAMAEQEADERPGTGPAAGASSTDVVLVDIHWRIDSLLGEALKPAEGWQEPHLLFDSGEQGGVSATVGCNRMRGSVEAKDGRIVFGPIATTMMACPPPLDEMERALTAALAAVASYEVEGDTLMLKDENSVLVAVLTAIPS